MGTNLIYITKGGHKIRSS